MDSDPAYNTIKSISEAIVKNCKVELTFAAWTSNQGPDLGFFLLKSYLFKSVLFSNLFFKIFVFNHGFILFIFSLLGVAG